MAVSRKRPAASAAPVGGSIEDLRRRAAALQAAADRLASAADRKAKTPPVDGESISLSHGGKVHHDSNRKLTKADGGPGAAPAEHLRLDRDMGRHETFGSALPIADRLAPYLQSDPPTRADVPATISELIHAHEMAYGYALYTEAYGLPDLPERRKTEEETFRALLHAPMNTDADRVAYAIAVISRQMHSLGDGSATERDHPLAVAYRNLRFGEHAREPEAMRHIGRAAESAPVADPIPAVIEAHRAAHAAWYPLMRAWSDTLGDTPEYEAAEAADAAARRIEREAFRALLATRPTTAAGCLAFTAYLSNTVVENDHHLDDDTAEVLHALRDSATCLRIEPATRAQPDPEPHELARLSAEQIDLTALDVFQLSSLFEAYQIAKFSWEGVGARPYSYEVGLHGEHHPTELAKVARFEEERTAWIIDRLEREIAGRKPEDDEQRDEILMVRTQQEFSCNRRINDNSLILDIAKSWSE